MSKKSRIFQTLMLFLVAIYTGCVFSTIGPTLPDLQNVFHIDFGKAPFLLFASGCGEVCGVCLASILLSRADTYLLMTVSFMTGITTLCCVPLAGSIYGAMVCFFVCSTSTGIVFVARTHRINFLWPETSTPMFFNVIGVSVGSVLAPSIAGLFTCDGGKSISTMNNSISTNLNVTDPHKRNICIQSAGNMINLYLVIGCMHIPTACWLIYYYFKFRKHQLKKYKCLLESTSKLTLKGKVVIAVFLFLCHFTCSGNTTTLGNLLSTFGTRSQMHFSATYMANMTSLFYVSVLCGRSISTLVSRFLTPLQIIMLSFGGLLVSAIVSVSAQKYIVALWIGALAFGFFNSPFIASIFAWIREYITLSSGMISLGYLGATAGYAIVPFLAGIFINQLGPNMLIYFLVGGLTFQCFAFGSLYLLVRVFVKTQNVIKETLTLNDL